MQSQVRFNRVPTKAPFREASVQSQVSFNRVPEKVWEALFGAEPGQVQQGSDEGSGEGSGRLRCRARSISTGFQIRSGRLCLVQSQVRFNRVPTKVPEKVPGGFGAEPGQFQQGSGEGLGGFGAEPGQVQQGSDEGSGEGSARLRCRARSVSTGFRRRSGRLWSAQSQVRFNRVPTKVLEKVPGGFGAEPGQFQQGSGEGLGGFGAEPRQVQQDLRPFNSRKPS